MHWVRAPSRFDVEPGRAMHTTHPFSSPLILIALPRVLCPHSCRVSLLTRGFLSSLDGSGQHRLGIGSSSSLCIRVASRKILGCLPRIRYLRRIQNQSLLPHLIGRRGIRIWGGSGVESICRLGL